MEMPVIFTGFMGAPVVVYERSQGGRENVVAVQYLLYFLNNPEKRKKMISKNWQDSVYYCDAVEKSNPEIARHLPKLDECSCAVCDVEIGGLNSTDALTVSAQEGILCLDADLMGRAFPELQMVTPLIYGQAVDMAVQVSDEGRVTIAFWSKNAKALEDFFRKICQENGGSSSVAMHLGINLSNAEDLCILGSVSRAWKLGKSVLEARKTKSSIFDSILSTGEVGKIVFVGKVRRAHMQLGINICVKLILLNLEPRICENVLCIKCCTNFCMGWDANYIRITFLGVGVVRPTKAYGPKTWKQCKNDFNSFTNDKVVDVSRKTEKGFTRGRMYLHGFGKFSERDIKIEFQNENLVISELRSKMVLVSVPDLICLLETDSGKPVMTEEIRYGLRVTVMILKPQHLLSTEAALKVVGPKAFGYDIEYIPAV